MSSLTSPLHGREEPLNATWHGRMRWLRAWLVVSCFALFASTWKLWTPQTVFPQIPYFAVLRTAPPWLDWLGLAVMLVALVAMFYLAIFDRSRPAAAGRSETETLTSASPTSAPSRNREGLGKQFATLLFVASLTLLVLLDQHRFQPWAYQFAIVAIALAFAPADRAASLLRVVTVGIYFWSAVSKFDYTFLHGLGPELLRGLLSAFHLEPGWMRPETATTLAWAFPLDELAIAILLAIRRTRTVGLILAIAMHVLLLATLGPFGLDHSLGVLLWNVYFIGQDLLLFRPLASGGRQPPELNLSSQSPARGESQRKVLAGVRVRVLGGLTPPARLVPYAAVFAAVWLPMLQPFGYLDYWPAWAVYAPAAERAVLFIYPERTRTPSELVPYFSNSWGPSFLHSRFDLWSFDALGVPLSPDGRFQAAVGNAVVERYGLTGFVSLSLVGRADRFTGERDAYRIDGVSQFRPFLEDEYWLNALPRKLGEW